MWMWVRGGCSHALAGTEKLLLPGLHSAQGTCRSLTPFSFYSKWSTENLHTQHDDNWTLGTKVGGATLLDLHVPKQHPRACPPTSPGWETPHALAGLSINRLSASSR